ncbi:hypothetical protein [Vibrio coralliilyticus]|uniref:hypothetical protein n=1 Tax=Vibrio coralliilyticus TaxID=190893 RepID=UPI0006CC16D7|nr:hypothetical protein [Vibrio coralliilyticus]AXN34598.1 hypothetical protein DVV14_25195 [Vibrio coralliilyticus]KPH25203.1 hypothetical protein ADU60_17155 [Vibrio coralliilyticus]
MVNGNVHFKTTCQVTGFKNISYANGRLYIDGEFIKSVENDQKVFWERTVNDKKQSGFIDITPTKSKAKALLNHGVISIDGETHSFFVSSYCKYSICIEGEENTWHHFNMGYGLDENGELTEVNFLGDVDGESKSVELNKSTNIAFITVDSNDIPGWEYSYMRSVLCAKISLSNVYSELAKDKKHAVIYFSPDYTKLTGDIFEYDFNSPDQMGRKRKIIGEYIDYIVPSNGYENTEPLTEQVKSELISSTRFLLSIKENEAEQELSINNLYELDTPEPSQVQKTSFNRVTNLIVYSSKDAQNLLGVDHPSVGPGRDLSRADVNLLEDNKISEFFDKKLSVAYVSEALHASTDKTIVSAYESLEDFDPKMGYFWSGDGETSLSQSAEFNVVISKINDEVFLEKTKGLQAYKDDNGKEWARKLYGKCIQPPTLFSLKKNKEHLSAMCSKLHALDPYARNIDDNLKNVSYATALKNKVLFSELIDQFEKVDLNDEYDIAQFLTAYMEGFFNDLLTDDSWQGPLRTKAIEELTKLQHEFKYDTLGQLLSSLSASMSQYMGIFARCLVQAEAGTWLARINIAVDHFFNYLEEHGRILTVTSKLLKALPQMFTVLSTMYSVVRIVGCFLDFDRLTEIQKAELISGTVVLSGRLFSEGAVWLSAKRIASLDSKLNDILEAGVVINNELQAAELNRIIDVFAVESGRVEIPGALIGAEYISETYRSVEKTAASLENWQKAARISEGAVKAFSIAALSFGCFMSGMACRNDFMNGQPVVVKVFDIMQTCTDALSTMIEFASIFVEIPAVGAVVAIAGIVIALINIFLPRKHPLSPVEIYIQDTSIPFVNSLDMPSPEWWNDHKDSDTESDVVEGSLILA